MKIKGYFIAVNADQNGAPEWVHLLPAGELTTSDGLKFYVDETAMGCILAAWKSRKPGHGY